MSGLARSGSAAYYQASGEATTQERLPEKFVSNMPPPSPIQGYLPPPHAGYHDPATTPAVDRHERMAGMRYLYALGHQVVPIKRLGADGTPYPWNSGFQRYTHGPIHDAGFNDALYQAGYGGFNLGLSFKVPTLPQGPSGSPPVTGSGDGSNQHVPTRGQQKLTSISQKLTRVRRATGQPGGT